MKKIEYVIKTLGPVAFAEKNNDSTLYTTKKYITSTSIRGVLAHSFINHKNLGKMAHEDNDFYDIFLSGKVRFLPAYPMGDNFVFESDKPFILPLSLMKHKTSNNIIDLTKEGSKIEVGYKKFTGFALSKNKAIYKTNTKTQIQLHIARSENNARITGSSQDGNIFNYEYIEPGQYFKGSLLVNEDIVEKLEAYLKQMNVDTIRVGHSKQVQYGRCNLKVGSAEQCDLNSNMFDNEIQTNRDFYLYAYTPYIPFTEWQRTDKIAVELLEQICQKLRAQHFNVELKEGNPKIFAANEEINGYIDVWRARYERKMAISAGSLIQFNVSGMDDAAVKALNSILYEGVGWRTVEGFGQFRLWQTAEKVELKTLEQGNLDKNKDIESKFKLIENKVGLILEKRILIEVQKEAKGFSDISKVTKKHILNRIEELMDSNLTKSQIKDNIQEFKSTAKNNLRNIYIKDTNLYDILMEEKGAVQPYSDIKWKEKLDIKLESIFDDEVFEVKPDKIYKHFWLWFARHAKKKLKDKE